MSTMALSAPLIVALAGVFFGEFLVCGSLSSESTRNVGVRAATKAISQEECLHTLVCNSISTKNGSADEMERGRINCFSYCNLQNRTSAECKDDCECDCRNVTCTFERRAEKIIDNVVPFCLSLFKQEGKIPSHFKNTCECQYKVCSKKLVCKETSL